VFLNDNIIKILYLFKIKIINQMFDFFAHHAVIEGDYVLEDIKVDEELGHGNAHVYTAYIK